MRKDKRSTPSRCDPMSGRSPADIIAGLGRSATTVPMRRSKASVFDHLVGAAAQRRRHFDDESFGLGLIAISRSNWRTMQAFWNAIRRLRRYRPVYQFRFIPDAKCPRNPRVSARMSRRLAQVRRDVAPQTRRVRHELPPRFHQQADLLLGTRRVAGDVRHRARGARSRRRLVGRRPLHRQSRLVEIAGERAGDV